MLAVSKQHQNIANLLAMLSAAGIEFETHRTTSAPKRLASHDVRSLYESGA